MIPVTHRCRECEGTAEVECGCNCPHCTEDIPCPECHGTGFDPHQFDVLAYSESVQAAVNRLLDGEITIFGIHANHGVQIEDYRLPVEEDDE